MRAALLVGVLCAHCAFGDVVSHAPEQVRVTLYSSPRADGVPFEYESNGDLTTGLAFVAETRTIDLPQGISRLVFRGVADAIVPQTASVIGLPATIAESNFDYDLLSPGALVARSHGERVRLVRTDAATGRTTERAAIVRTGPEGVMLEVDGQLEALDCNGLDEKIVYERVPPGLASEPTLSMTVRAARAGRHRIELSYLALGLDWTADYVATLHPDGRTLALTGWLTLVNRGSTTFAAAPTDVVAGQLACDAGKRSLPKSSGWQ
jgi:hypothetical protein